MPGERSEVTIEERLVDLGQRRLQHDAAGGELADEIRTTIEAARRSLPLTEIARLLGMDRSGVYRTYLKK